MPQGGRLTDKIIIAVVVLVVVAAHFWLYAWVKFKMQEGVILQFLRDSGECAFHSSSAISAHTNITIDRVAAVCNKSRQIGKSKESGDAWSLN